MNPIIDLIREVTGIPEGTKIHGKTIVHMCGIDRTKAQKKAGWGTSHHAVEVKGPKGSVSLAESGRHREIQWSDADGEHFVHFEWDEVADAWAEVERSLPELETPGGGE